MNDVIDMSQTVQIKNRIFERQLDEESNNVYRELFLFSDKKPKMVTDRAIIRQLTQIFPKVAFEE